MRCTACTFCVFVTCAVACLVQRHDLDQYPDLDTIVSSTMLQDQYPEFRRIWEEEMLLIRADDTAFWHMEEPDVKWDPNEFQPHKLVAKLVFPGFMLFILEKSYMLISISAVLDSWMLTKRLESCVLSSERLLCENGGGRQIRLGWLLDLRGLFPVCPFFPECVAKGSRLTLGVWG